MTRTGWAAMRQKMTPWMLVETISSDTPIIWSVLSARVRQQRELSIILKVNKIKLIEPKKSDTSLYLDLYFTQKPSKSDGRGKGSEVDEDDGSEDLRVQSVCVVADVVAVTTLQILHHPTERIACTGQRVLLRLLWRFLNWSNKSNWH